MEVKVAEFNRRAIRTGTIVESERGGRYVISPKVVTVALMHLQDSEGATVLKDESPKQLGRKVRKLSMQQNKR